MTDREDKFGEPMQPWELYSRGKRFTFLFVLFLVGTSSYVDKNIIGVLLEQIKVEFQVSDTRLGLLSGISFALFYATLGIPVARWADRGDRKSIITVSLIAWSVMTGLCGLAGSFWQLAAARFGVGAGEAGAIPPAQSLLADYYPPAQRAGAIGVFMMSATAGYAIGLIFGGWVAQHYGWRIAFGAAGVWGLVLAPFAYFLLQEPRRIATFAVRSNDYESIATATRRLLQKIAYRYFLLSLVLYFLMAYGTMVFLVSFLIRVHGMHVAQAGMAFGVISAIGAVIGNLGGGLLADRLARRNVGWHARLAGWGMMVAVPLYVLALSAETMAAMTPMLLAAIVLMWAVVPPMWAALHAVCGSRRRATAVAIALFLANLIGLGLGPLLTGSLSDHFAATYGTAEGLRYALMIAVTAFLPAGVFMLCAERYLHAEVES